MKLFELLNGINNFDIVGTTDKNVEFLSINSKNCKTGSLFFCITGTKTNGCLYVEEAIKNGTSVVVLLKSERQKLSDIFKFYKDITFVFVDDVRKTMAVVSSNFYDNPASKLKIVGVTGTNGKSSTSFLICKLLKSCGKNVGLIGTSGVFFAGQKLDYNMTTPESIDLFYIFSQMVASGVEYCVMEVSAHAIFFDKIFGINFAVKVLTNVKSDHLDFFKTQKNYENTKQKFFETGDIFVVNFDDKIGKITKENNSQKTISFGKFGDFCIKNAKFSLKNTIFDLIFENKLYKIETNLVGKFNTYNLSCAIAVVYSLGFDIKNLVENISNIGQVSGRFDCVFSKNDINIIVDFAHTFDSLKNLLTTIKQVSKNKNIIVFGCPGERDSTKRFKMGKLAGKMCDLVILTSDNPASENPRRIMFEMECGVLQTQTKYQKIENREMAIKKAIQIAKKQTHTNILVVGKGVENYQIVGDKHIPYSDYEVIKKYAM